MRFLHCVQAAPILKNSTCGASQKFEWLHEFREPTSSECHVYPPPRLKSIRTTLQSPYFLTVELSLLLQKTDSNGRQHRCKTGTEIIVGFPEDSCKRRGLLNSIRTRAALKYTWSQLAVVGTFGLQNRSMLAFSVSLVIRDS